jgi:hypothetical protein
MEEEVKELFILIYLKNCKDKLNIIKKYIRNS